MTGSQMRDPVFVPGATGCGLLIADANDDFAEGSALEVVEGFGSFGEGVYGVEYGPETELVEFAKHVFQSASWTDGDASQDGLLSDGGEERYVGVEAFHDADDRDLSAGLDGIKRAGEVGTADDFKDVIDALVAG